MGGGLNATLFFAVLFTSYAAAKAIARWKGHNEYLFGSLALVASAAFVPAALLWPPVKGHVPATNAGSFAVAALVVWALVTAGSLTTLLIVGI
jgi:hypothetical protein